MLHLLSQALPLTGTGEEGKTEKKGNWGPTKARTFKFSLRRVNMHFVFL